MTFKKAVEIMKPRYRFVEIQEPGKPPQWQVQKWHGWCIGWKDRGVYGNAYRKEEIWKSYVNLLTDTKVTVIHDSKQHADAASLNSLGFPDKL